MKAILLFSIILLSGCSTMSALIDQAGELNDDAIRAANVVNCEAASIGSIKRYYFSTPEGAKLWQDLCKEKDSFIPSLDTIPEPLGGRSPPPKDPK